ncbi:MAG: hypothetical protein WCT37_02615 [Patescibacteria group bacterium]|jgi:hypothetical protein
MHIVQDKPNKETVDLVRFLREELNKRFAERKRFKKPDLVGVPPEFLKHFFAATGMYWWKDKQRRGKIICLAYSQAHRSIPGCEDRQTVELEQNVIAAELSKPIFEEGSSS